MDVDGQESPKQKIRELSVSSSVPAIKLSGGFKWSAADDEPMNSASGSSDDTEGDGTPVKAERRKKKKAIQQDLTANMHNKAPESSAEFERLLRVTPNSSFLWIQFMSFQLQLSEIDKAREIGRRALQVISFREEQEKLNVWIALLNLEVMYGTDESLDTLHAEAAKANDSKTVYLKLASILEETGKLEVSI